MTLLAILGGILIFVGWIWNIVTSFKMGGTVWGIVNIFFQPLVGIISAAMKKTQWAPVGLMIVGVILYFIAGGMSLMTQQ